jgi:hypothetical protein
MFWLVGIKISGTLQPPLSRQPVRNAGIIAFSFFHCQHRKRVIEISGFPI